LLSFIALDEFLARLTGSGIQSPEFLPSASLLLAQVGGLLRFPAVECGGSGVQVDGMVQ
jgi:hypothetical protein